MPVNSVYDHGTPDVACKFFKRITLCRPYTLLDIPSFHRYTW